MRGRLLTISVVLGLLLGVVTLPASAALTASRTYTFNADFDEGVYSNVVHSTADQLQLDDTTTPFRFIWVAVSTKGTIVKIDTDTGNVLGEYWTSPEGQPKDPSRTTVDLNGNVWNTNRAGHSVVQVGLKENGQCVDRDGDGIETSTGLGDIKPWPNTGGADTGGGISTAQDECILHYVLVNGTGTRHLSVTPQNDVWVGGLNNRIFDLVDGATGAILRTEGPAIDLNTGWIFGGYGGLIDKNGVIWSANPLLRWNTSLPLSGPNGGNWTGYNLGQSYGLCIDSLGNVWNSSYGDGVIRKFAANGTLIGTYSEGSDWAQGCVIDKNDDVWVAHSLSGSTVGHLKNDGTYVGTVAVGSGPTGVAVDALGKVWATNYNSGTVSRIDPALGGPGGGGSTIGAVDFTTVNLGGNPYNYSDMTGSTLTAPPNSGTWTVVFDSGAAGTEWGRIGWNDLVPAGAALSVTAASSEDNVNFSDPPVNVAKDVDFAVPNGRYLKVSVIFNRAPGNPGQSPILYDLTIRIANQPPVVDAGGPYSGNEGAAIPLSGASASDPDLDPLTYAWTYAAGAGVDAGATCAFSDATILNPTIKCTDDGTFVATLTVKDGVNAGVTDSADVVVANVNPVVNITTPLEGALYALGAVTNLTAAFTDAGTNDTHTCSINWDDGTTATGTVTEAAGAGACTGSRTFAGAGVYTILVTVTDDDGGAGTASVMVIVYDPSAGFVTGGGKILSPAGAYVADPTLTGPANFGFVSKYQKGAKIPTGQTEFQFQMADFNFHSESYQWLVVAGARAQYKGTGTLNGVPGYGFLLTAVDGQVNGGGGVDKFRIKIWNGSGVVYDNVLGASEDINQANPTAITSGSIVVHSAK